MHVIRTLILDETERDIFARVAHLVPLAYPTPADTHRPSGPMVDDRDPRLRVLAGLATQRGPVTYSRARLAMEVLERLAVEVLERLAEMVQMQATEVFWLHVKIGKPSAADRKTAAALAAERRGQAPRVQAALSLARTVTAQMTRADDPDFWAAVEDDLVSEAEVREALDAAR